MFKAILGLFKKKPKIKDFPVKKSVAKKVAKKPTVKKATTRNIAKKPTKNG